MVSFFKNRDIKNLYFQDAGFMFLFGTLSVVFSQVQFEIPGVGNTNLREIPLLVGLIHLRNPVFIIGLSFFTLVDSPPEIPYWVVILVHLGPLLFAGKAYRLLERWELPDIVMGLAWIIVTVLYYMVFLIPLVVISINIGKPFLESYLAILPSARFEIIASALVTSLYLIQLEVRKTLEQNNKNLEKIVYKRTSELIVVNDELQRLNKELLSSNDEIKELNENLEKIVKERTDKINDQLNQLMRYAHMNSHEVRAPLARMLGLLQLIKYEKDARETKQLLDMLYNSSIELDRVIKEMNRLLEREVDFSEK
jgi:signal transduction histidine kinase